MGIRRSGVEPHRFCVRYGSRRQIPGILKHDPQVHVRARGARPERNRPSEEGLGCPGIPCGICRNASLYERRNFVRIRDLRLQLVHRAL